jgi:hypothetical protein
MHPATAVYEEPPRLTPFEAVFVQTVLEHRGIARRPTLLEFTEALRVLQRYEEQCRDNPREADAWEPEMAEESRTALRAMAFLMFGATKPLPSQWHKAHAALYGPLLCETCG